MVNLELTIDEACNLFDALHYYGKCNTLDTAENMILGHEPVPLINHWSSFDEFLNTWSFFYKLSREFPRTSFGKILIERKIPDGMELSKEQIKLLSNREEYQMQACFLLSFFDSMSDSFEYEIKLMEHGYPFRHKAAS